MNRGSDPALDPANTQIDRFLLGASATADERDTTGMVADRL
jgi:hypothetical protein